MASAPNPSSLPRVVIVGGGFAGLYAAKALRTARVRITVVDRTNYHLFQPMLYQVATAALDTSDIASPIRSILRHQRNTEVLMADVTAVDTAARRLSLADGTELGYDLFLGVPVHRAPDVVVEAGMTVDGWIPVDPLTLETRFPDVYAVGDVTSVGTPKAGVFAEGQAAVVADRILARTRGDAEVSEYGGRGICYLEFGEGGVAQVDVTFLAGQAPFGGFDGPSPAIAADKVEFGASRIRRWFA